MCVPFGSRDLFHGILIYIMCGHFCILICSKYLSRGKDYPLIQTSGKSRYDEVQNRIIVRMKMIDEARKAFVLFFLVVERCRWQIIFRDYLKSTTFWSFTFLWVFTYSTLLQCKVCVVIIISHYLWKLLTCISGIILYLWHDDGLWSTNERRCRNII